MKKYGRVMSHDAEERSKEKVILNSQVRINKPFKISLNDISFHISINSLRLYLTPEFLPNSNFYIPSVWEKFSNVWSSSCQKCINSSNFQSCHSSLKNRTQVLVITPQEEVNYSSLQAAFFQKTVSPAERARENSDFLYQNSVRK